MKWLTDVEVRDLQERGFNVDTFENDEKAFAHLHYLEDLKRDPSYLVSIGGLYRSPSGNPAVVCKVRGSWT